MITREKYLKKIRPFYNTDLIKVISGFRRSGKSVLLEQIKDELVSNGSLYIMLNFESHLNFSLQNSRDLDSYVADFMKNTSGTIYMFFDEIQNVEGWEKSINSYRVTYDCDIYITGSNSKLLSSELATHIAGRYVLFNVFPLSFSEFKQSGQSFEQYLHFGGMPFLSRLNYSRETCLTYLNDVYNSVILKDIVARNRIRDVDLLSRLINYVIQNNGKSFSARSIEKYFKSVNRKVSVETILNYLSHCADAYLFYPIKNNDIKRKELLTSGEKYYIVDHGLRLPLVANPLEDIGLILENIVLIEALSRGYSVSVGNIDGREIDFILSRAKEVIYVQVSYLLASSETINREFGVFGLIPDNYKKYVVSMDTLDFSRDGIIHKNIEQFLETENW
ncbi:MAG: ATP-binding protein [Ruminococcaceae bacterium]|nr:ATP-binding protein [Oscillospiraceae bacterium]